MEGETTKIWEKIHEIDDRLKSIEELIKKTPEITEIGNEYEKLITETGIGEEELIETIYFENGSYKIIAEIDGKTNKKKMLNATLLILTINDICYGSNRIRTQDLKKKLEYLGIGSLANLSTNMKSVKRFVIPDGKRGSKEYGYKLTLPGRKEGIRLLSELTGT